MVGLLERRLDFLKNSSARTECYAESVRPIEKCEKNDCENHPDKSRSTFPLPSFIKEVSRNHPAGKNLVRGFRHVQHSPVGEHRDLS